jgi:hypothetical protein
MSFSAAAPFLGRLPPLPVFILAAFSAREAALDRYRREHLLLAG